MSKEPVLSDLRTRIAEVRKLVSSPDITKEQKKELGISTRIDTQLAWGFLMHAVQDASPLGSIDFDYQTFEDVAQPLFPMLSKPESVKQLVEEIRQKESVTKDFRRKFSDITTSPESVGNTIFESLTGEKPNGDVTLINTPLAIMIQINEKADYEKLGSRKSGGFFKSEAKIHKSFKEKELFSQTPFQLICVRNIDDETKKHEVRHGINKIFKKVLSKIGNSKYWSEGIDYSWDKWEQWFEKNHPEEYASLTENSRIPWYFSVWTSWIRVTKLKGGSIRSYVDDELVPVSLGRAKDEVIADFEANGNFDYINELLKSDLEFSDALYDYVAEWFDSSIDWKALNVDWREYESRKGNLWPYLDYKNGWENYTETLKRWVNKAKSVHYEYVRLGLTERVKIYGELLVQTPLKLNDSSRPYDINATLGYEIDKVLELSYEIHRSLHQAEKMLEIYDRRKLGQSNYYDDDHLVAVVESHLQDEEYREKLEGYRANLASIKDKYHDALVVGQRTSLIPVVDEWAIHFETCMADSQADVSLPIATEMAV